MQYLYRFSGRACDQERKPGAKKRWLQLFSPAFLALAALLILVFATGGASRSDVDSLLVLRPVATGIAFLGLFWMRAEHWRANWFLLGWTGAVVLLTFAQLVPLPPKVWQALPDRNLIAQIDQTVGLGDIWRPLTMTPGATRNAFWSLMPPLACLVLAVQLDRRELRQLMGLVIVLGFVSAFLAMLQLLGDPRGPLYLYDFTNNGAAVGLFANRNHQALLLAALLPMLTAWAFDEQFRSDGSRLKSWTIRRVAALSAAGFVIPLVLITGSRAGLALGLVALGVAGAFTLHSLRRSKLNPITDLGGWARSTSQEKHRRVSRLMGGLLLIVSAPTLIAITVTLNRDLAIDRLLEQDIAEDARTKILPTVIEKTQLYLPWGSGMGSFEQVFQVHEPDALLAPTYMNHAHNDWLELVQTGGIPALALLATGLAWAFSLLWRFGWSYSVPHDARRLGQVGASFLVLAGLGSIGDYPLRVPSLACLLVLAMTWIGQLSDPGWTNQQVQR